VLCTPLLWLLIGGQPGNTIEIYEMDSLHPSISGCVAGQGADCAIHSTTTKVCLSALLWSELTENVSAINYTM